MSGGEEERNDGDDRPLGVAGAIFWTCAVLGLVVFLILPLTLSLRPGLERDVVNSQICFALALALVIFGLVRWHLPGRSLGDALALRPTNLGVVALAILLGFALQFPLAWLSDVLDRVFPRDAHELAERAELFHFVTTWHKAAAAFALVAIAPFFEEMLFRGAMYRALRLGMSPRGAIVTSAVAFAFLHCFDARALPYACIAGLLLGYLRHVTGTVIVSMQTHMAFNGVETFFLLSGIDSGEGEATPVPWKAALAGAAAVALIVTAIAAIAKKSDVVASAKREDAE